MNDITLASLFEIQGLKEKALEVYKNILKNDPQNKEAIAGIRRISGVRKKFRGVNEEMKQFFISMSTKDEFSEFERWLVKLCN